MKYKIDKGDHFSKLNIGKLQPFVYKWRGTFEINSNWWYGGDEIEYSGWNKLGGVSEFFTIHRNSARLVFQPDVEHNKFIMAGYVYSNGERTEQQIPILIDADREYQAELFWNDSLGVWEFWIKPTDSPDSFGWMMQGTEPKGITRKCYPYFGGKSKAPNNVSAKVKY